MDWPLRAKVAALLVIASVLPLAIATSVNIQKATGRINRNTGDVLAARADHLADQLDVFNRGYQRSVDNVARLPLVLDYYQSGPERSDELRATVRTILEVWPKGNSSVRGLALLDLSGKVMVTTEDTLLGMDLSYHSHIREALNGIPVISNVYIAESQAGSVPTIAYLAPIFLPDRKLVGVAAFWVNASALWDVLKASNELAGPGSFAVLFDHFGVRIGHSSSDQIVFHPGGPIEPATVKELVAERRFGENTRQYLDDVMPFTEQFDRALAESPDLEIFRGFAPVNQTWNYGVARRFRTVPWTVFYMVPDQTANAKVEAMWRENTIFTAAIMMIALIAGLLFASMILRPVRLLSGAAKSIGRGDLSARVPSGRGDELGQLGETFNQMAEQIETQSIKLKQGRDELEIANRELEAFSYSVSHDLRAPLRHINGFSQVLLEDHSDKLDDTGRKYLQEVREASNEMALLIDDVLKLARVTRSDIHREVVNLSELARSIVVELKKMDDRDVAVDVVVDIENGLSVDGDKRFLRIVLTNLLDNAWKFTSNRPEPRIVFGHEQIGEETVYFVRDNGAGFDMTYADKLFGTFQRLHAESEFYGTGIGLATVRRIIDRHGGRVWGEGKVDEGATFYFTIPDRIQN